MILPAFRRTIRDHLLRPLAFNTDPQPLPPMEAVRQAQGQPREPAICQGLVCVAVTFGVYGAYFVTHTAAQRVSATFAPFAFVGAVHIIYVGIYALERCRVIGRETRDNLTKAWKTSTRSGTSSRACRPRSHRGRGTSFHSWRALQLVPLQH